MKKEPVRYVEGSMIADRVEIADLEVRDIVFVRFKDEEKYIGLVDKPGQIMRHPENGIMGFIAKGLKNQGGVEVIRPKLDAIKEIYFLGRNNEPDAAWEFLEKLR